MRLFCSKIVFLLVLFSGLLLSACTPQLGIVDPPKEAVRLAAEDSRNEGKVARRSLWEEVQLVQPISFCYNGSMHEEDLLLAEAGDICKGGDLEFHSEGTYLRGCPLFQSTRVTYICAPDPNREE